MRITLSLIFLTFAMTGELRSQEPKGGWKKITVQPGYVASIAFYTQSEFFCGGSDGKVLLVDATLKTQPREFYSRPNAIVTSVAACRRLGLVLVGYLDGTVQMLSSNGEKQMHFEGGAPVYTVKFSPTHDEFAACVGNDVGVWRTKTGELVHQLKGHKTTITCLDFSSDGKHLATGSSDGEAIVWDLATQRSTKFSSHRTTVRSVCFVSNNRLASCSLDNGLVVTDLASGKDLFQEQQLGRPSSISYDSEKNKLMIATFGGSIRSYSFQKNNIVLEKNENFGVGIMSLATSVESPFLIVGFGNPYGADDDEANKGELAVFKR